ncbi:hypothetical protein P152DRAFT_471393 [Eremomyces bilateralis CBS 781.70]|uniref:Inositol hexakisphosphate and diphosphoinositol-pentakisphosphate kinase n=1 Tax=Eremomyces bilateralis CBS 781.70 TaxID=1392243 RepID=A0A6G1G9E8_9PEZI|nr:uncharacterized protein P152DRAFT_471393 [Eremomyces bilateralis CBS 781.70]KAF1814715.1 hypothetical protein P152DRAFT_471393 [Eremomyces bilateralis CBS 781.70]
MAEESQPDTRSVPTPPQSPTGDPSSAPSPANSRKGRSTGKSTDDGDIERVSSSMPPSTGSSVRSVCSGAGRSGDEVSGGLGDTSGSITVANAPANVGKSALTSPGHGKKSTDMSSSALSDSAIMGKQGRGDADSNRMSFSSLYSLGQSMIHNAKHTMVAGASAASSVAGSEIDAPFRSDQHGIPTTGSSVSITTSSQPDRTCNISNPSNPSTSPRLLTNKDQTHHSSSSAMGIPYSLADLGPSSHTSTSPPSARSTGARSRSRHRNARRVSAPGNSASPGSDRGRADNPMKKAPYGIIGVCALDSKARSKPSRNILNKLIAAGEFDVIIFGDKVILDEDVENWPVCDFLISFFSAGFPLEKAIRYAELRKPFCVNDLPMQMVLWDRRTCLRILDTMQVPTPKRIEVNRDGGPTLPSAKLAKTLRERTGLKLEGPDDGTGGKIDPPKKVEMMDDGNVLFVDGKTIHKPFVEKPVSGEDHNIRIYYHGGGGRRLFRKVNNKSSEHDDTLNVPRCISNQSTSYVYEQFLQAEGAEDIKLYTVGSEFCHAETRKSPVVDGHVRRNPMGKEIRYVTNLTKEEQTIATKISEAFGQRVCGFDLLRANGSSYVIDVNGWSFVKDNNDYYDRCAGILRQIFIREKMKKDSPAHQLEIEDQQGGKDKAPERAHQRKITGGAPGSHRAALKSIFKSPSMSKMTDHHGHFPGHHHAADHATSDASTPASPIKASSSMERNQGIPPIGLPPPAALETSTADLKKERVTVADSTPSSTEPKEPVEAPIPPPASKAQWKLKGIVSVVRHADRTPKQKFKFTFHTKPFVDLLKGHQEEVLLIGEQALSSVLDAVQLAFQEGIEDTEKLTLLRTSLIKKGGWTGTKVQIKPMFREKKAPKDSAKAAPPTGSTVELLKEEAISDLAAQGEQQPLRRSDSNTGITFSRIAAAENNMEFDKLQLVIKWGGEPTHSARYQAQDLGENLRNDLLLLNKNIFDDVSVFSSSERRVTTSAQIFSSAFLAEEKLSKDFVQVRKHLLDDSNAAKDEMDKVKKTLKVLLREGDKAIEEFAWPDNFAEPSVVVRDVVQLMQFHRDVMRHNYATLQSSGPRSTPALVHPQDTSSTDAGTTASAPCTAAQRTVNPETIQARWCCGEDAALFRERWEKLFAEFCDGDKVDPSKISELYDTMKFDALHNRAFLEWAFRPDEEVLAEEMATSSFAMVDTMDELQGQDRKIEFQKRPAPPVRKLSESKDKDSASSLGMSERNSDKETGKLESSASSARSNLAQRLNFRRRSEAMSTPAKPLVNPVSYFNLDRGSGNSKSKPDARLVKLRELFRLCKVLFDYIGPQEYGMANDEKLEIGLLTSLPLLKEIVLDLEDMQAADNPKGFFYFTKESHIYTLLNCVFEGGIPTKLSRNSIPELDYLSQICFELYESQNASEGGEVGSFNYSIRITISPGCHTFAPLDVQLDSKHSIGCAPRRSLTPHIDWLTVIETFRANFSRVRLPKSFVAVNLSEKVPQAFGPPTLERERERGMEREGEAGAEE